MPPRACAHAPATSPHLRPPARAHRRSCEQEEALRQQAEERELRLAAGHSDSHAELARLRDTLGAICTPRALPVLCPKSGWAPTRPVPLRIVLFCFALLCFALLAEEQGLRAQASALARLPAGAGVLKQAVGAEREHKTQLQARQPAAFHSISSSFPGHRCLLGLAERACWGLTSFWQCTVCARRAS